MHPLTRPLENDRTPLADRAELRPAPACEAEAARRYAFDGLDGAPVWGRVRCTGGTRYRMFFLRSRADGSNAELCWRVYEICDGHVHRLRELDDALIQDGQPSQLHPLTASSLRLIEARANRPVAAVRSLPAL